MVCVSCWSCYLAEPEHQGYGTNCQGYSKGHDVWCEEYHVKIRFGRGSRWTSFFSIDVRYPACLFRILLQAMGERGSIWKVAAAHQPDFQTMMGTNNFVESWHKELKSFYLERRQNRQCDHLVYILVHDFQFGMEHNVDRAAHSTVRISAGERQARQREVGATSIPSLILENTVRSNRGDGTITVSWFTKPDEWYIFFLQNKHVMQCDC